MIHQEKHLAASRESTHGISSSLALEPPRSIEPYQIEHARGSSHRIVSAAVIFDLNQNIGLVLSENSASGRVIPPQN